MELIAQGRQPQQRWRRKLLVETKVEIGRAAHGWSVEWDEQISRRHAAVVLREDTLVLRALPNARNPIFVDGQEVTDAKLSLGEHFVIGQTTFTFSNAQAIATIDQPRPVAEQHYSADYLRSVRYRNADKRVEVLSRLPDLIRSATTDAELFTSIVNVLIRGVPRSNAVAVVKVMGEGADSPVVVLHWDCRGRVQSNFRPSEKLIRQSLEKDETTIHIWNESSGTAVSTYTQRNEMDWAFCTPVPGTASEGWALYIAGANTALDETPTSEPADFRDDLKFAESAAAMLGNLRVIKQLERGNAALAQFFSPPVLELLEVSDPEVVLAPREAEISVLFCDLRGFSMHSERSADDLFGLLDNVSRALGVMTRQILLNGGVVGDFQGDSVMGFWGWPIDHADAAVRACRTAVQIQHEFDRAASDVNAEFGIGMGIATGTAVAGKIGTVDQFKVTVFGPVVNLASRLEGMTKPWGVPILIDKASELMLQSSDARAEFACRPLGLVQPAGMTQAANISELRAKARPATGKDDQTSSACSQIDWLSPFQNGDWDHARELLHSLQVDDGVRKYVLDFMSSHAPNGGSPPNWDGVIRMKNK